MWDRPKSEDLGCQEERKNDQVHDGERERADVEGI